MHFELYGPFIELFVSPTSQELEIIKVVMSTKEEKDIMVRTYRVSPKKKNGTA